MIEYRGFQIEVTPGVIKAYILDARGVRIWPYGATFEASYNYRKIDGWFKSHIVKVAEAVNEIVARIDAAHAATDALKRAEEEAREALNVHKIVQSITSDGSVSHG